MIYNRKSVFTSIRNNNDDTSQITELLLRHGADPKIVDSEGVLPLQYAIHNRNMLDPLLDSNKIDFEMKFTYTFIKLRQNRVTSVNTTIFHVAVTLPNASVILKKLLDKYPAGINATDEHGETPLIVACRLSSFNIINMLFEKEDLDFLHCNNEGKDALEIIQDIPANEDEFERKNKESYHQKIIELLFSHLEYNVI